MRMNDQDKLAQEIYVRQVLKEDVKITALGSEEFAEKLAVDAYRLAEAFMSVKKRHERGSHFASTLAAQLPGAGKKTA